MPDEHEPNAQRPGDTGAVPSPEWYAEQWDALCDVLGATAPENVVPRVRTLKEQLDKIDAEADRAAPDGLVTISEVEEVFQEMHTKLKRLRERNAALLEQLESEADGDADATVHALHADIESLLQALDVSTVEEGQKRVESLQQQLATLYADKEALVEAGLTDAEEALAEINRLHDHAERLATERDRLESDLEEARDAQQETQHAAHDVQDIKDERDRLESENQGLRDTVDHLESELASAREERDAARAEREDARDAKATLEKEVASLQDTLDSLRRERDGLREERDRLREALPDEDILASIEAMESILGLHSPEEARALARSVRRMKEQFDRLEKIYDRLQRETGLNDADDMLTMIDNMEKQLVNLYQDRQHDGDRIPDKIVQTLGISSPEQANELARAVRRMDERLRTLSNQHERLTAETGLDNADDALTMIRSLEEQLVDLYQEREEAPPNGTTASIPEPTEPKGHASNGTTVPDAADDADARDAIAKILGVSTPEEAEDLAQSVRRMSERLGAISQEYNKVTDDLGLDSADDVLTMIRSLEEQLVDLYQTIESKQQSASNTPPSSLAEGVEEVLGISSVQEARELEQLVHDITNQLEHLTAEQEKLREQGLESVDGALAMIDSMEDQLIDLYEAQNKRRTSEHEEQQASGQGNKQGSDTATDAQALMPTKPGGESEASQPDAPESASESTSEEEAARPSADDDASMHSKMASLLGVETAEDVEQLASMVRSMSEQLDRLATEHQKLLDVGLSVDHALSMIESMEEQLVDLYREREEHDVAADAANEAEVGIPMEALAEPLEALHETLGAPTEGDFTSDHAPSLQEIVGTLQQHAEGLRADGNRLLAEMNADDANAASLDTTFERIETRLQALLEERDALQRAEQRLDGIREVLGIETREQAQELAELAHDMDAQLKELQREKEHLDEMGLTSVQDAVQMIRSMEEQLDELYRDKENLQQSTSVTIDPEQDTFQQLQSLYAEQEKLERELGVSSADAIIEMVEGLATQLDDFYSASEGMPYDEASNADASADAAPPPAVAGDDRSAESDRAAEDKDFMILSMREQLETLYREKEPLFEHGMGGVEEAVSRIQALEERTDQLRQEKASYEKRLQRLRKEVGTADIPQIINMVRALRSRAGQDANRPGDRQAADRQATDRQATDRGDSPGGTASSGIARRTAFGGESGSSSGSGKGLFISAAPQFVDDDLLARLESMSSRQLNNLPYGVIRLSDEGRVEFVNEKGLSLPGLKEADNQTTLSGKNFFLDLAPSTKNNLFFGRFKEGVRQGAMDARFPYTFISPGRPPQVLTVHLHRKPGEDANWLLFRSI